MAKRNKGANQNVIEKEVQKLMEEAGENEYLSENIMARLRSKYNDHQLLDQIQETYMEITREQKSTAKKFAKKVLHKYGLQYPLHILLKKAYRYKQKYNLSDVEFSIFHKTYVRYILGQENVDSKVKKFYTPHTYMTKTLGTSDRYSEPMNISNDDYRHLDKIMKLEADTKAMHAQISLQSMTYPTEGFSVPAITGKFDRDKNWQNPTCFVHPVIAAMFIPKFKILEDHILLASIPRILKQRKNKKNITTIHDYELFYDIITDPTDMACSVESPMLDLLFRSELQFSIWQSVLMLRYGKYFDCSTNAFLLSIDNCKLNNFDDAPDFLHVGDEGSVVRRILSAFSLRPTIVETSILSNLEYQYPLRPEESGLNIRVESTPMLTHRITRYPMQGPRNQNYNSISYVLSSQQYFYDKDLKTIVPRHVRVIYSNSILIINIPRRAMKLDYSNLIRPAYEWNKIPRAYAGIDKINDAKIDVPGDITVEEAHFSLQSAIKLDVDTLNTSSNEKLIVGTSCILRQSNDRTKNILGVNDNYLLYDPKQVINPTNNPVGHNGVNFNDPIGPIPTLPMPGYTNATDELERNCTVFFYKNIQENSITTSTSSLGVYYPNMHR